ncbi:hypothetical protein D9757_002461 [Collybiopsis confluens]|uniref:Uncharacterized protein n=1 Tax=Collybiopsis confluens TaxID=2823264 RepID=A0A8H5HYA2_9AGAR|nr:hypothetical protein D9757_002461 [Collybiopsis confluens]
MLPLLLWMSILHETGQDTCVDGAFSQCVDSKFMMTPCASGLSCFALLLLNSNGTSLSCATQADALARCQTLGVDGGIDGNGAGLTGTSSMVATSTVASSSSSATGAASADSGNDDGDMDCGDDDSDDGQDQDYRSPDTLFRSPWNWDYHCSIRHCFLIFQLYRRF